MTTQNSNLIDDDGLVIFDSSTGTFDGVELTTKGDLLTRTASAYTRLGVGTDTHTLTSNSAQSEGIDFQDKSAGSSFILLQSQTASSSTSIDFTTPFDDSTYLYYLFTYTNVRPATDGVELRVRFSIDGGSSFLSSSYRWVRKRFSSSSGGDSLGENDSDSKIKICVDLGNAVREGLSGKAIYIPSTNPGGDQSSAFIHDNTYRRDSGTMFRNIGGAKNGTSSTINGIRWYMDSGNIATGTWKMYGVTKS